MNSNLTWFPLPESWTQALPFCSNVRQ